MKEEEYIIKMLYVHCIGKGKYLKKKKQIINLTLLSVYIIINEIKSIWSFKFKLLRKKYYI